MKLKQLLVKYEIETVRVVSRQEWDKAKLKSKVKTWLLGEDTVEIFNELYTAILRELKPMVMTESGSISVARNHCLNNMHSYAVMYSGASVNVMCIHGTSMFQIRMMVGQQKSRMTGFQAYMKIRKQMEKFGILEWFDSKKLDKEEGLAVKAEIEKPLIEIAPAYQRRTLERVRHIDYHSAWPGGLKEVYPEFAPMIDDIYECRKTKPENKLAMNAFIGYCQSKFCGYGYSWVAKAAMNRSTEKIMMLAQDLKKAGRTVLGFNTDGIWYAGDVFHGVGEGKECGQWENDICAERWRAKSNGAYEYETLAEDGFSVIYKPVVRGFTSLDRLKTRDKWEWGDIFRCGLITGYHFDETIGFVKGAII